MIELFIENYRLDVGKDEAALLTFAIDDISSFSSRNTSFSKTIHLPGTARNNKVFGHIFRIGHATDYDGGAANVNSNFNAAVSATARLFNGNIQTHKGTLRLLQINHIGGVPEYEVSIFGEMAGFIQALGASKLEDLDFSAYDHIWNTSNMTTSWDNPGGSGYVYAHIDFGNYGSGANNKLNWDHRTFRPALTAKEYIDKIFESTNYTYSSALFNTTRFKKLIVPPNTKTLLKSSSYSFYADAAFQQYNGVSDPLDLVTFGNIILLGDFSANVAETEFTSTATQSGTVTVRLTGAFSKSAAATLQFRLLKNGVSVSSQSFGAGQSSGTFDITITYPASLVNTDILSVEFVGPATYTIDINDGYIQFGSVGDALVEVEPGDTITMNDTIPKNYTQLDFLSWIVKLFDLYIYDSIEDDRKLFIEPYPDFYATIVDNTTTVDWSSKLDRSRPVIIKPMSELNARYFEFKFKQDSDHYNELYRKRYNEGYGDYVYDSGYDFAKNKETVEIGFSATPVVGYVGEDKVFASIFKMNGTDEEQLDHNIRLLQYKKISGVASWSIMDGVSTSLSGLTDYCYAGHFDDPDTPTNDLNFGATRELFIEGAGTTVNQFNVYWSPYMAEITDKDSKLVEGWFKLDVKDIYNLDFSKYVYVDGILYRLNKIEDWNANYPDVCKVTLLKVLNTTYS